MDMLGRIVRMENQLIDLRWAETKNPRLMMIDPDDGMIVRGHNLAPSRIGATGSSPSQSRKG
jgi:hypothetical protein